MAETLFSSPCGRTTRGQAAHTDSSPAQHVSQGDRRQLSTADGTNELFSFPYKRGGNRQREEKENSVCFYKGEDVPVGREKKGTHHLLGMATTDPDDHPMGALHGRIVEAVTLP